MQINLKILSVIYSEFHKNPSITCWLLLLTI